MDSEYDSTTATQSPRSTVGGKPRLIQSRYFSTILQFFILWLVIVARCFLFNDFANNEVDLLPSAQQSVESTWLPGDWYLNLDIGYRSLFNSMAGPLVSHFGFKYGAVVGRLLVYLLFAYALLIFMRTFHIRFAFGLLFLIVFLNNQTLIAGEWMIGGLETKALAWPLVLLSLSAIGRKRWFLGFAFAGGAFSFHILVGFYALSALGVAFLLNRREYQLDKSALRHVWIFFLTGAWGIYAVIQQLFFSSQMAEGGWSTYVHLRVPHHVLPEVWNGSFWIVELSIGAILFALVFRYVRTSSVRFFAAYALGSLVLFAIGLIIWGIGSTELLRFYWFRFPDTIVPFGTTMLLAFGIGELYRRYILQESDTTTETHGNVSRSWKRGIEPVLIILLIALSVVEIVKDLPKLNDGTGWASTPYTPMFDWIATNTPHDATFLIDPSMQEFYVRAERAAFVSFKHSPQSAKDIAEWHKRLVLCNGGAELQDAGFGVAKTIRKTYYALDPEQIGKIATEYNVDYYLGKEGSTLPYDEVHSVKEWILYKVK